MNSLRGDQLSIVMAVASLSQQLYQFAVELAALPQSEVI
jgi:hypothetical protein